MNNDSKSTLHGNKPDQDKLTDDQLQAVSGGWFSSYMTQGAETKQGDAARAFAQLLQQLP